MKKFKTRKNNKYIIIIAFILFLAVFVIVSFIRLTKSHSKFIGFLTNNFKDEQIPVISITNNLDYLINSYSFKNNKPVYIEKKQKIYLYNTNNFEMYQNYIKVGETSKLLKNNLNKLGIDVILENQNNSDLLFSGMNYYDISRIFLKDIMKKQNDIAYYIDIHRDSSTSTTISIDNKKYATIKFILGSGNINYRENKMVVSKMNNFLIEKYPGLSRGIYEEKEKTFNQDLSNNILLIVIGGINNNLDEINNSTEILALMVYHMLGD